MGRIIPKIPASVGAWSSILFSCMSLLFLSFIFGENSVRGTDENILFLVPIYSIVALLFIVFEEKEIPVWPKWCRLLRPWYVMVCFYVDILIFKVYGVDISTAATMYLVFVGIIIWSAITLSSHTSILKQRIVDVGIALQLILDVVNLADEYGSSIKDHTVAISTSREYDPDKELFRIHVKYNDRWPEELGAMPLEVDSIEICQSTRDTRTIKFDKLMPAKTAIPKVLESLDEVDLSSVFITSYPRY